MHENAKKEYQAGSAFWAEGLLAYLEERASGTGFLWTVDSIIESAEMVSPEYKKQISELVKELSLTNDEAMASCLLEKADSIWCSGLRRVRVQANKQMGTYFGPRWV